MQIVQSNKVPALGLLLALLITLLPPGLGSTLPVQAAGVVSLTTLGAAYSENFDTLANTGTSSTVPNGWDFVETGTNANTVYTAGTGSSNTGDTYSFGAAGSTERAFGGLLSGSLVPLVGVQFANNTGGTITSLAVAYTGEQWRLGTSGRADKLEFQYSTDAASLNSGTWTDLDLLDFVAPVSSGTVGLLDGNAAANRAGMSAAITGLAIPNGATFWLRWSDANVTGADDGLAVDDFSLTPQGAGDPNPTDAAPSVASTSPVNGDAAVALNANVTVNFSEGVNVNGSTFTLLCGAGGTKTLAVSGGPTSFTLDPDADFAAGESCTLAVSAANVADQDTNDPPDIMAADFAITFSTAAPPPVDPCAAATTPIPAIQGAGPTVAVTGPVTTKGIVVGDYEGASPNLRGFFIQDPAGDGNPATSDGIFVFNGDNSDKVSLGDLVLISGTAGENQGQSQVSVASANILKCGTGTVAPTDVTLPFAAAETAEQYEGMLVRFPQTLYVTEHFQLGRFGQVVLSSGARLPQPTNVVAPGAAANALQAQNNLNKIILDDASQAQNPDPIVFARGGQPLSAANTLRGGDTATGIVGVMTYTWAGNAASPNAYRIRPLGALNGYVSFEPANLRPTAAPAPAGSVRVAGMNLLNFFNTFDGLPDNADNCRLGVGGGATDCRGADTGAELDRQWPKTVAAIVDSGADIIGVNEVENDGYGPDSALQFLIDKLNAATAPGTYAFIDADARTGQVNALGTDAIKVGMIFRPAKVTPVGQTAALNTLAFVNGGDGDPRNRPALAQAFEVNGTGARFTVVANHLKSKGSPCDDPDAGDGQGNCSVVRTNAALELANWLAADPTGTGDPDVLIVGDLNSYAKEDPITALLDRGYTNLIETFLGEDAYSYVFDGQWGYLDHALANAALLPQVAGVAEWHINADEPSVLDYNTDFKTPNLQAALYAPDEFRIADHDPVLVDLNLANVPPSVAPISGPSAPIKVGAAASFSAAFTDPSILDTHTAVWDWGDGTTSAGVVTEANGSGTVAGSHTYAKQGIYTVVLTVADENGGSAQATFGPVIVYATNGGFVLGAGAYDSPAGGRAAVAFLAQYPRRSATVPAGEFQLQLRTPRFHFAARSFDWLVITDNKAQFQGTGVVDGGGSYGFLVVAVESPGRADDLLRIKIWDKNSGNAVVYDTQEGAPDSAAPATALHSGAIVVFGGLPGLKDGGDDSTGDDQPLGIINRLYLPGVMR